MDNSRVGEAFQDHPALAFGYEFVDGEKSLDVLQNTSDLQEAMTTYMTNKTGPLSSGAASMAFVSYADLATTSRVAAIQKSILAPTDKGLDEASKKLIAESLADHGYGSIQIVIMPDSLNPAKFYDQLALLQPPPEQLGKQGFTMVVCLARPVSAGSIDISSSDPTIDPAIDPGYLTHPADIEVLAKGLEMVEKMVSTSPFKEKVKRRYHPETLDLSDKKSVEAYLRKSCATAYHPMGSVAMGKNGVGAVDERLRVWGTKGLRVVDASVMPLHISGNLVATA